MNTKLLAALFSSALLFGCGDTAPEDKGEEENPLTDGKSDSFFQPTEHGDLRMGVPNRASFTADEMFHSWQFELSDDAKVELTTDTSSRNLDTVMYVYKRLDTADSWGRFHRKNDDDGDSLTSRILLEGEAAQYRVVVKGHKKAMRGAFTVNAECAGPGCQANADQCDPDEFESLPTATPFTNECAFVLGGMLASEPVSQSSSGIELGQKCQLVGLERTAIDLYHEWWDDIVGFDDQFRFDPDEDVFLNFSVTKFRSGLSEVSVDAGGDEDGISFYFDENDKLLAAYQHNQSPTVDFYCGIGDAPQEEPTPECFEDWMWHLPHETETARVSEGVAVEDAADEHAGIGVAMDRFAGALDLDPTDVVDYDLITWESIGGDNVIAVNLMFDDFSAEYYVHEAFQGWNVIMTADANGVNMVCE